MMPSPQVIQDSLSEKTNELVIANHELIFLLKEKEKISSELLFANEQLAFEIAEKEKRAAELLVANEDLTFQNAEKEKRAQELLTANKELAYQNAEKERRANELITANKELAFQNHHKQLREAELVDANNGLQRTERQLKEVNSELEAFSYSVSHDLRAPLRAISGYSEILREEYSPQLDSEGHRIIQVILHNTKMMGQLIDDLLVFSKMARLEVIRKSVDMKSLALTCVEELSHGGRTEKYKIEIDNLPECTGDPAMLKQVWFNLIDNALKYSSKREKPEINIGYMVDGDRCHYFIKDSGTGFDTKYAKNLFGVFQRLHRQDEFEGTGLGLALAKRIINKHGGDIVADAVLHQGATFTFNIPKYKTHE